MTLYQSYISKKKKLTNEDHISSDVNNSSKMHLELVANNLSFPTSLAFDDEGSLYVAESGLPFDGNPPGGKVWKLTHTLQNGDSYPRMDEQDKILVPVSDLRYPINGLTFHKGSLYISDGGYPGRIIRFNLLSKKQSTIVDNLPGLGNYHTNMVAFGPDGKMYFSQGAMTNTGIIGLDAYELAWLNQLPHNYDIPGHDIVLKGFNAQTNKPRSGVGEKLKIDMPHSKIVTGAFVPFGTLTYEGQKIVGQLPCTASIMRCDVVDGEEENEEEKGDGKELVKMRKNKDISYYNDSLPLDDDNTCNNPKAINLELVAWGLRNSYGIGFMSDTGKLLAIDQGADNRGSRPVENVSDFMFEVKEGAWYGWPDFMGGEPITDKKFMPKHGPCPSFLLDNHDSLPRSEKPLVQFPSHSAATKFDIGPTNSKGIPKEWNGQIFVALFGDEKPMTTIYDNIQIGRSIVRIDPTDNWSLHPFYSNERLLRPIDVKLNHFKINNHSYNRNDNDSNDTSGSSSGGLYVLDFGQFEINNSGEGITAKAKSGKIWKISMR